MTDGGPVGYNSAAAQGNYLEAINLSFNGKYKWKNKSVYVFNVQLIHVLYTCVWKKKIYIYICVCVYCMCVCLELSDWQLL